ncbi:MAG TPA: hypothetical protein VGU22_17125 [Methylomirabilota bacterium]|jgi:hypothetical protein|nr:hypothetical protein [Methylomirabilota bacterium]
MNAHALAYPSLQRRLISQRRSRAFFSPRTTQHLRSRSRTRRLFMAEIARTTVALGAVAAWSILVILLAA